MPLSAVKPRILPVASVATGAAAPAARWTNAGATDAPALVRSRRRMVRRSIRAVTLEDEPDADLNLAAIPVRSLAGDLAEVRARDVQIRIVPHGVVERVVRLEARFEPLGRGQIEHLGEREVHERRGRPRETGEGTRRGPRRVHVALDVEHARVAP